MSAGREGDVASSAPAVSGSGVMSGSRLSGDIAPMPPDGGDIGSASVPTPLPPLPPSQSNTSAAGRYYTSWHMASRSCSSKQRHQASFSIVSGLVQGICLKLHALCQGNLRMAAAAAAAMAMMMLMRHVIAEAAQCVPQAADLIGDARMYNVRPKQRVAMLEGCLPMCGDTAPAHDP